MPGTGKTATVTRVVRELQNEAEFKFIELNGMQLRKPEEAYIVLWNKLAIEKGTILLEHTPTLLYRKWPSFLRGCSECNKGGRAARGAL